MTLIKHRITRRGFAAGAMEPGTNEMSKLYKEKGEKLYMPAED